MDIRMFDVPFNGYGKLALSLGLFSDLHLEVGESNKKQKAGIEDALSYDARLSFNGDSMDFIYPGDPRFSGGRDKRGGVTAKLNMDTEYLYEFFRPYVDHIDVIGAGNHEKTLSRHYNYDVLRGVLALLNKDRSQRLPPIYQGAYQGYQIYNMGDKSSASRAYKIFRHHLRGGSAPISKGMIDIARVSDGCDDADLYWGGHKHTSVTDNGRIRKYVTPKGIFRKRTVKGIITAGYGGGTKDTTALIDAIGDDDGYEDSHYTNTPEGWGLVRVYPLHNNEDTLIKHRVEAMV